MNETILIIGLGNPELTHSHNRHNVGFMAIDQIQKDYSFENFIQKNKLLLSKKKHESTLIILCKPLMYMNLSGKAIASLFHFLKIKMSHMYVIHDDIDLKPFQIKTKIGGGHGGHNGLRNIDAILGKEYNRVRIGVGRPICKEDVSDYVLSDFDRQEKDLLAEVLHDVSKQFSFLFDSKI